jgi:hypothetical protein
MDAIVNGAPEGRLFYGKPLTYRSGAHRYYWAGEQVTSVTTILGRLSKPALIQWAANMAVDHVKAVVDRPEGFIVADLPAVLEQARKAHVVKKTTAADIGTYTHAYAQDCLQANHLLPLPDPIELAKELTKTGVPEERVKEMVNGVLAGCEGFRTWFREHTIQTIEVERPVMFWREGPTFPRFAGRTDFYGRIDDTLGTMDVKTSGGVYEDYWLQLQAYDIALTEELKPNVELVRWVLHLDKKTGKHKFYQRPRCPLSIAAFLNLARVDFLIRQIERTARNEAA